MEAAAVYNHTTDGASAAVYVLGRGVHYNIGTVCKRLNQIRRCRCAVQNQRDIVRMHQCRNLFQIYYIQLRISDQLCEHGLCLGGDQRLNLFYRHAFRKACGNAERLQIPEQVNGAAEQTGTGNDLISGFQNIQECHGNCCHAGRACNRADAAFHCCHSPFKRVYCGITDTGIRKAGCLVLKDLFQFFCGFLRKGIYLIHRYHCGTVITASVIALMQQCSIKFHGIVPPVCSRSIF